MEKKTSEVSKKEDRLIELLNICNDTDKPNAKGRKELQELIKSKPFYREVMQEQEGLYTVVLRSRIENLYGSDSFKELMYIKCAQLREELGYETANQLERLAIEHIVLCWLNHLETEIKHTNALSSSHNFAMGVYWEKRLTFTSRRYTKALEILSRMRKMNLVVQVNNANNQIVKNI